VGGVHQAKKEDRNMKYRIRGFWLVMAAAAVVTFGISAFAIPTLLFRDGVDHTATVADGSALDSNPNPGVVTWIDSMANWKIDVGTGIEGGIESSPRSFDLSSVNVSTSDGGTLQAWLSDNKLGGTRGDVHGHGILGDKIYWRLDGSSSQESVPEGGTTFILFGMGLTALRLFARWYRSGGDTIRFRTQSAFFSRT
jgi:hypothetical protein